MLALVVLLSTVAVAACESVGRRLNSGVSEETKAVLAEQQGQAQQRAGVSEWADAAPFYMLLLGVDSDANRLTGEEASQYGTADSNYRTDTIILARVDSQNKKLTLVSIHRDTLVEFDGGRHKINAAFSAGGVPKTIEVVSEFAGVPISHYAQINLDGLYAIVDALGGVEVDVPYPVNDDFTGWTLDAGPQILDGENAEVFVRSRHGYDELGDGDRYRAANQRLFIAAVMRQLLAANPAQMVASIDTLANYVTTDLSLAQVIDLALAMRGLDVDNDVYSTMNPTTNAVIDQASVEISDDTRWAVIMAEVDSGKRPDIDSGYISVSSDINSSDYAGEAKMRPDEAVVVVKDASGADRGPEYVARLRDVGWVVVDGGTANVVLDETTVVYELAAASECASQIAGLLGCSFERDEGAWDVTGSVMVVVGRE